MTDLNDTSQIALRTPPVAPRMPSKCPSNALGGHSHKYKAYKAAGTLPLLPHRRFYGFLEVREEIKVERLGQWHHLHRHRPITSNIPYTSILINQTLSIRFQIDRALPSYSDFVIKPRNICAHPPLSIHPWAPSLLLRWLANGSFLHIERLHFH